MRVRSLLLGLLVAALLLASTPVETAEAGRSHKRYRKPLPNIAELVISINEQTGQFSTLLAGILSVDAANEPNGPFLVDALMNEHLTVFAPTDEAFFDIGLDPNSIAGVETDLLTEILLYHITGGKKRAKDLVRKEDIKMLNGDFTRVTLIEDPLAVFVNESKVIKADIKAKNGIVHVIDEVLMLPPPPSTKDPVTASAPLSLSIVSVPEPSSMALCLLSVGLFVQRRQRS